MHRAFAVCLMTLLALALSDCRGEREYETVADLHEALVDAPDFGCNNLSPADGDGLTERFDGLTGFGACSGDGLAMMLVFDDAEALERFNAGSGWIDFQRAFWCVRPGDVFRGVAGRNWLLTGMDPQHPVEVSDEFLTAMDASRVHSQPADTQPGTCG